MATPSSLSIQTVDLTGGQQRDFTERAFGVKFSTVSPGGDDECSFTYVHRPTDTLPERYARVFVRDTAAGQAVWLGRVEGRRLTGWTGNRGEVTLTCKGYMHALGDQRLTSRQIFRAETPIEEALEIALTQQ